MHPCSQTAARRNLRLDGDLYCNYRFLLAKRGASNSHFCISTLLPCGRMHPNAWWRTIREFVYFFETNVGLYLLFQPVFFFESIITMSETVLKKAIARLKKSSITNSNLKFFFFFCSRSVPSSLTSEIASWYFRTLDVNNDDQVNRKEAKAVRKSLRKKVSQKKCLKKLMRACDSNNNKKVTQDEFLICLQAYSGESVITFFVYFNLYNSDALKSCKL